MGGKLKAGGEGRSGGRTEGVGEGKSGGITEGGGRKGIGGSKDGGCWKGLGGNILGGLYGFGGNRKDIGWFTFLSNSCDAFAAFSFLGTGGKNGIPGSGGSCGSSGGRERPNGGGSDGGSRMGGRNVGSLGLSIGDSFSGLLISFLKLLVLGF